MTYDFIYALARVVYHLTLAGASAFCLYLVYQKAKHPMKTCPTCNGEGKTKSEVKDHWPGIKKALKWVGAAVLVLATAPATTFAVTGFIKFCCWSIDLPWKVAEGGGRYDSVVVMVPSFPIQFATFVGGVAGVVLAANLAYWFFKKLTEKKS